MNYANARRGYLEWYSHLLSSYDLEEGQTVLDVLEHRIDGLNLASEELTKATLPFMSADGFGQRITALNSLLAQIEGDLQVANVLWSIMENAAQHPDASATGLVRPLKESRLRDTFRSVSASLPLYIDPEGQPSYPQRGDITLETALEGLNTALEDAFDLISERASTVSIRLVRDILAAGQDQWVRVEDGIRLLQGYEKAGDIGWGLEDEVDEYASQLAGELRGTLINIVEKIIAIIEKNDLVRYTIADWLDDLHHAAPTDLKSTFNHLLAHLYQTAEFREKKLPVWLKDALDIERILAVTGAIRALEDDFEVLTNRIRLISSMIGESSVFAHPLLLSVGFGLRIGLLCTVVFAGYDHLDEGTRALNITKGIKQLLIEELPVSQQTLEMAENLSAGTIR